MKSLLMNIENVVGLNPKYWRNRAEEARVVAESMQDEQSKQLMLGVVKEYERVVELTEKRLKGSAIAWKARCFCIVFATAARCCGVGTSWDLPILSA
jgi:hypothetical protein